MLSDGERQRRRARSGRQKARIRLYGIPTETYLNGGSYTSNLVPPVGRGGGEGGGNGRGGEKGTKERLDTRKITCAVYYAFPCNGSIIRVFIGGDLRGAIAPRLFALFLTSFFSSEIPPPRGESYKGSGIIFRTCGPFCPYISSARSHEDHFPPRGPRFARPGAPVGSPAGFTARMSRYR